MKSYTIIIASRTGSKRLPGKALLPLNGIPMLQFLIKRLKSSKRVNNLILATTKLSPDDELEKIATNENINIYRGSENDVVKRFVEAARSDLSEYIVRVTADCPFVDGATLDYCIDQCEKFKTFDLATTKTKFPVGIDFEIYKKSTMADLHTQQLTEKEREHLTLPIYHRDNTYCVEYLKPLPSWSIQSNLFTVDTPEDYLFAKEIVNHFGDNYFSVKSLLAFSQANC